MLTLDDIEDRQRRLNEKKDDLQSKKEKLNLDERSLEKQGFNLKTNFKDKENEYQTLSIKINRLSEVENAIKTNQARSEHLQLEINKLNEQQVLIGNQKDQINNQLRSAIHNIQEKEKMIHMKQSEINNHLLTIKRLDASVNELNNKCIKLDLTSLEQQSIQIINQIQIIEQTISSLQPELQNLNNLLLNQEHERNQVKGNLDLRQLITDHNVLEKEFQTLELKLSRDSESGQKLRDAQREYQRSLQEKQKLSTERDKLTGHMEVYNQQIIELKKKLENNSYRGIDEKCRKKTIEYEVTVLAVNDLGLYYEAL